MTKINIEKYTKLQQKYDTKRELEEIEAENNRKMNRVSIIVLGIGFVVVIVVPVVVYLFLQSVLG